MVKPTVAILGTGMAGLGACHQLRDEPVRRVLYDQYPHYGGHTATLVDGRGFSFDQGPHISFTKDARIQALLAEAVDDQYETLRYQVNNYWRGYRFLHPVQVNLYGLPADLVTRIITDFVEELARNSGEVKNYAEWLLRSYGRTLAETFPMEYTLKYHTTEADNLTTDWIGPRMYRPKLEEMVRGALSPASAPVHYFTHFRYPSRGGFGAYLRRFARQGELALGHELVGLDPRARRLRFANGQVTTYDFLVSSIPLPDLIPMIDGVPADVRQAAEDLACSACVLVNLGVDRADLSDAHVTYFYDRDVFFTRLSFPHMFSSHNAPAGAGSIQAEVYFSKKYRRLDRTPEACVDRVIQDLRRVGLLREADRILYRGVFVCEHANVIFDLARAEALRTVHGYLDDVGVAYCGRYGDWGYHWTDESFLSGERAARTALERR